MSPNATISFHSKHCTCQNKLVMLCESYSSLFHIMSYLVLITHRNKGFKISAEIYILNSKLNMCFKHSGSTWEHRTVVD